jgi:hypothetical protein
MRFVVLRPPAPAARVFVLARLDETASFLCRSARRLMSRARRRSLGSHGDRAAAQTETTMKKAAISAAAGNQLSRLPVPFHQYEGATQ